MLSYVVLGVAVMMVCGAPVRHMGPVYSDPRAKPLTMPDHATDHVIAFTFGNV